MKSQVLNREKHSLSLLNWLFYLITFLSILYGIIGFLATPKHIMLYINPDVDAYIYLAHNLIYQHGSIFDWNLGTAPYYFPDVIFIYLASFLTKNPYPILLSYAFFQIVFFITIIALITRTVAPTTTGLRLGLISGLLYLLIVDLLHSTDIYAIHAYIGAILAPSFHFGCTLIAFTCLFLFIKIIFSPKISLIFWLSLFAILGGISDPLMHIFFTLPSMAIISLLFVLNYLSRKNYFKLMGLLTLIFIVTYTIYHLLPIPMHKQKLIISFNIIYLIAILKSIYLFFIRDIATGSMWLFFVIYAPISLWRTHRQKDRMHLMINYVILFEWLSVVVTILLLCFIIKPQYAIYLYYLQTHDPHFQWSHLIHYMDDLHSAQIRYLIPMLIGPAFLGFPLLLYKHLKFIDALKKNIIFICVLLLITGVTLSIRKEVNKNLFLHFQPKLIHCIDQYINQYHLKDGIADGFISSNMVNAYEQNNLRLAMVDNDLVPVKWQNTSAVYRLHDYNFAVIGHNQSTQNLFAHFGKPDHHFICPGNAISRYDIYVYENGALKNFFSRRKSIKKI